MNVTKLVVKVNRRGTRAPFPVPATEIPRKPSSNTIT